MSATTAPLQPLNPVLRAARSEYFVLLLCVVAAVFFAIRAPGFGSIGNFANILASCLSLLMLASGQTFVLITGGIDLSVTAIVGFASVTGALVMTGDGGWLAGHPAATALAIVIMLLSGAAVGFLNGACVAWLRMPAFMVTLTTMMFFGGFSIWLAKTAVNSESLYTLPSSFITIGSHPWISAALAIFATLLAHVVLSRTLLGRWLYAVGHNARTASVSGVPTGAVTMSAYVLSGLFASIAAIFLTARLETGSPSHGKQLLLDVIGAAIIGGTSLFGGKGKVPWTVFGVLFLALLGNGLNQLNLSDFLITIIKGTVILTAALLDVWRNKRSGSNA